MRIEIKSSDRIGISQEILTVFARQAWNLKAVEVSKGFTFAHLEHPNLQLNEISDCLASIDGIISVSEISLLPIEQRENHLQTLLDRIPDPIIDIDHQGTILAVNAATQKLLINPNKLSEQDIIGRSVEDFAEQKIESLLTDKAVTLSISFNNKVYLADISPVLSKHQQLTGAMITLRSMKSVGRQLALMQSYQEQSFENIIGQSAKILLIKEQSERFAKLDLPVLISGETGTGKELIARALHHKSPRAKAPFLAINCASLPEHLLESELFGYSAGAFTGASKAGKPGLIELAEGGSLFLDEIAEMSIYLQAKLLRFLQDFSYRRVGGTKELYANVRIISASHQDLPELIAGNSFREDLFYRLNVLNLDLPPLRERADDIALLAQHFIDNASKQVKQSSKNRVKSPELRETALALLKDYHWPGNIRQLQNILFSVVALNNTGYIEEVEVAQALAKFSQAGQNEFVEKNQSSHKDWASAQADFEKQLLIQLYPLFPTTRKLAERLNVSHNKIAMKLRQYNIK